ncbi:MAG TPA: alanine dehydrogenase [Chromatiales bacterium]|nr:alanine dehydrogenase [Chromatiales bacterium]
MRIGVPKEIKPLEGRVALVPEACGDLDRQGHEVLIESGAGVASGFEDGDYANRGVEIVPDARTLYSRAQLIVKVKEPWGDEIELLRQDHLLFCFLHLAANVDLIPRLCEIGLTAVAFETVADDTGLPVLAPMSDIAGRIAVQMGTTLLHRPQGGKGLLLGGLAGVKRGRVVVLGAGQVGGNAARLAAGMGAEVVVFDRQRPRLEAMRAVGANVTALYAYNDRIAEEVARADLLIGAVLLPGARTPRLVSREQVAEMGPGSVIVDVSVDQGGCIETTRPTTWEAPTYTESGITHFGVTNMPGAVPRSASQALCAALMPYVMRLAEPEWWKEPALQAGINVEKGHVVHPALTEL